VHVIEEGEKNPSEKRTDRAKELGLPPSTPSTIIVKKKIREYAYVCGLLARNMWCAVWEEMCGQFGSGSCVEEVQGGGGCDGDDEDEAKFYGSTSSI
jgi:hypothetical protein